MKESFEINRTTRKMVSPFLENYSVAQLNKIPEGFTNSLIWNIGHIVVVQQMLVYKLSGLPMAVSDEMVEKYRKGSRPENDATQAEVEEIHSLLFKTIDQTESDYNNGLFLNYQEYPTTPGYVLNNANDAIHFNNSHEALHIGIMMSIRKFI